MAKNVALSNEVIEFLERHKKGDESYSDVIKRLAEGSEKPNWRDALGLWKDDNEFDKIFDDIIKSRLSSKRRVIKW